MFFEESIPVRFEAEEMFYYPSFYKVYSVT